MLPYIHACIHTQTYIDLHRYNVIVKSFTTLRSILMVHLNKYVNLARDYIQNFELNYKILKSRLYHGAQEINSDFLFAIILAISQD